MVSIEEAKQQLETARALLEQRRREADIAEARIREQATSQQALRSRFGGRQGIVDRRLQFERSRVPIEQFRGQLSQQEQAIGQAQQEISAVEARQNAINQAIRDGLKGKIGGSSAWRALGEEDRQIVRDQIKEIEDVADRNAVRQAISQAQKSAGMSLSPEVRNQIARQVLEGRQNITFTTFGKLPSYQDLILEADRTPPSRGNLTNDVFPTVYARDKALNSVSSLDSNGVGRRYEPVLSDTRSYPASSGFNNLYSNLSQTRTNLGPTTQKVVTRPLTFRERLTLLNERPFNLQQDIDTFINAASGKVSSALINKGIISQGSPIQRLFEPNPSLPRPSEFVVGAAFGPAFSSGTAQTLESEFVYDYVKGRFVKKSELSKAVMENIEERIKEVAATRPAEALSNFREILRRNLQDKVKLTQLERLMKRVYGNERGKILFKDLITQEIPVLPKKAPTPRVTTVSGAPPANIPATGAVTGAFAGLGLYERTSEVALPIPRSQTLTSNTKIDWIGNPPRSNQNVRQLALQLSLQLSKQKQIQLLKQPSLPKQGQPQIPRTGQPQRLWQPQAQRQPQLTMQMQRGGQRQVPRTTPRQRPKTRLRGGISLFLPPKQTLRSQTLQSALGKLDLDVFIRRRGKDVRISSARSEKEAARQLFGGLKGSLAASGYVKTRRGERVNLSDYFGAEFRPAKRDSFRVVQRRGFRLGTQSERREIQSARNSFWGKRNKKIKGVKWW